jgi:hypothetical protein
MIAARAYELWKTCALASPAVGQRNALSGTVPAAHASIWNLDQA